MFTMDTPSWTEREMRDSPGVGEIELKIPTLRFEKLYAYGTCLCDGIICMHEIGHVGIFYGIRRVS
jgi:hypothetical protein